MGWACGTYGRGEGVHRVLVGKHNSVLSKVSFLQSYFVSFHNPDASPDQ